MVRNKQEMSGTPAHSPAGVRSMTGGESWRNLEQQTFSVLDNHRLSVETLLGKVQWSVHAAPYRVRWKFPRKRKQIQDRLTP